MRVNKYKKRKILDRKLSDEIARLLNKELHPEKIILFGSYAEGCARPESDVDVLVVTKENLSPIERYALVHKLFKDFPFTVQLVLITPEEFEETKDVIGGIAYPAFNYGVVLYEK
ncbi:MAG: nucleotidyltransferase domain-containing protein [Candidatus Thermoplasmatota archaeon]